MQKEKTNTRFDVTRSRRDGKRQAHRMIEADVKQSTRTATRPNTNRKEKV